jgi:hypothetical protein
MSAVWYRLIARRRRNKMYGFLGVALAVVTGVAVALGLLWASGVIK